MTSVKYRTHMIEVVASIRYNQLVVCVSIHIYIYIYVNVYDMTRYTVYMVGMYMMYIL